MKWITSLLGHAKRLSAALESVERNREDLKVLREEFGELARRVDRLHSEFIALRTEERLEREKLVLQLENALLRFEKRLPAPKSGRNAQ